MNKTFRAIKNKITLKDLILQGSVLEQYKRCGKQNCRCHQDKKYWHGPYLIWTRKENGKTITKTLSKKQEKEVKKSLKNMKEIHQLLEKWKMMSLVQIEKM